MLQSGDYVVIERSVDGIAAGHICRALAPDETNPTAFHRYAAGEAVLVLCWTGFIGWTTQDNLIEVSGDGARLERLFGCGVQNDRTSSA